MRVLHGHAVPLHGTDASDDAGMRDIVHGLAGNRMGKTHNGCTAGSEAGGLCRHRARNDHRNSVGHVPTNHCPKLPRRLLAHRFQFCCRAMCKTCDGLLTDNF